MKTVSTWVMGVVALAMFGACGLYGLLVALPEGTICECREAAPQCQQAEVVWTVNGELDCINVDILCELRRNR